MHKLIENFPNRNTFGFDSVFQEVHHYSYCPDDIVSLFLTDIVYGVLDPDDDEGHLPELPPHLPEKDVDYWRPRLHTLWHVVNDPFDDFLALLGLTKDEFRRRFCLPQETYTAWCNGDDKICPEVRLVMAEAVGVFDSFDRSAVNKIIRDPAMFNTMYDKALSYKDPDTYVSDVLTSPDSDLVTECSQDELIILPPYLRTLWHIANDSFDDFLALLNLTEHQFDMRFHFLPYAYRDKNTGDNLLPAYIRLMAAEAVGLFDPIRPIEE